MKVIVIRPFYHGDEACGIGDELDVPDNQALDWLAVGLVERVPDDAKAPAPRGAKAAAGEGEAA